MFDIFKKDKPSITLSIEVTGNFPTETSMFLWSEPTASTIGFVKYASPTKIILSPLKEEPNNEDRELVITLIDGSIQINGGRKWNSDYVKTYITFYNTNEEKKTFLQKMIDYKIENVIPKYEKELNFHKEELEFFIKTKDNINMETNLKNIKPNKTNYLYTIQQLEKLSEIYTKMISETTPDKLDYHIHVSNSYFVEWLSQEDRTKLL